MKSNQDFENIKDDLYTLPWLVNGSLNAEEVNRLKKAVEKSPELQKELDFLISMRTQVKKRAQSQSASELAWQRFSKDMKNQVQETSISRFSGLSRKFSNYVALAATVALGISVSNYYSGNNPDGYYDPLSSEQKSSDVLNQIQLIIRFNPNLSRQEIDKLLSEYHLIIISGPSSADLYRVQSSQTYDGEKLIKQLEALGDKIEYVQVNE